MRERAVDLARRGFRVFKLQVNGKLPVIEKFYDVASDDADRVREMWSCSVSGETLDNNIGVLTGDGLAVLDVDVKEGKDGLRSLEKLLKDGLPEKTPRVRTASGGIHLYYQDLREATVRSNAEKVAPGIDVRGWHGYVVGPGSEINGKIYEWESQERDFSTAAPWPDLLGQSRRDRPVAPQGVSAPAIELDQRRNIARAYEWLREAPRAIQGQGGRSTTMTVANLLGDFGLSVAESSKALLQWNETHAYPMWDEEELIALNKDLDRSRDVPRGAATAEAEFNVIDLTEILRTKRKHREHANPSETKTRKLHFLTFKDSVELATREDSDPLVKGLLDCGAMSVLYGDSNVGKTFIALDIANSIASGRSWNGRKVKQGSVIYVAAEGGRGIHRRNDAWQRRKQVASDNVKLAVIPCSVDLRSAQGDLNELIGLIRDAEKDFGEAPVLIVVDTLSRALAGGDENSSVDMGAFIRNCDRLRSQTLAHLMVVHHTGKDKARGARGWSGIRAAIDTEIEVDKGKISVTKQRDMDPGKDIRFELEQIVLGQDGDGDPITSAVAMLRTASEFERLPLTPGAQGAWEAFQLVAKAATAAGDWRSTIVTTDAWEDEIRHLKTGDAAIPAAIRGLSPRNLRLLRQSVVNSGYVRKISEDQWLAA